MYQEGYAHREVTPLADRTVITALRNQVKLYRTGGPLTKGRLKYFRKAIAMKTFHEVVARAEKLLELSLFSTLQDIEAMEEAIKNNDYVEFIVQCCIILHLWERDRAVLREVPDLDGDVSWILGSCRCLEEIAYVISRSHFDYGLFRHRTKIPTNHGTTINRRTVCQGQVSAAIGTSLASAVIKCYNEPNERPKWLGLLLVFLKAFSSCKYELLGCLEYELDYLTNQIPTVAATLFLSSVADAIHSRDLMPRAPRVHEREKKLISRLLNMGASPMVSRGGHSVLFWKLTHLLNTTQYFWWMFPASEMTRETTERWPTAFGLLMLSGWSHYFEPLLAQSTCCRLDVASYLKPIRKGLIRVPSLACLAAQNLRESDLNMLPLTRRFIASKHLPISLRFGRAIYVYL